MKKLRPMLVLLGLLVLSQSSYGNLCEPIQAHLDALSEKARGACRCYTSGLGLEEWSEEEGEEQERSGEEGQREPWVACTRREVIIIHEALQALPNDTHLARLWIWDSLMPILPVDLLDKARPRQVVIETSRVGKFDLGALDVLGDSLRTLDLKNNVIRSLKSRLFQNLTALRRLDLSGNQNGLKVEHVNASALGRIPSLRYLNLQRNGLSLLGDATFAGLSSLRRLNLAGNALTSLSPAMFFGLHNLEFLSLADNRIQDIPPNTFAALKNLKTLHLGGNKLNKISLSGLPQLESLQLENNSFTSFDNIRLTNLPALEILSLDLNQLSSIPDGAFAGLPSLASLSLTGNRITDINPSAFANLPALAILSLQNNRLRRLPDGAFPSGLFQLFLSGNRLSEVGEQTFAGLANLRALSLARNELYAFHPFALAHSPRLRRLHLAANRLQSLDPDLLHTVQATIKTIDLSDNPWLCNCSSFWMSEWTRQHIDQLSSPPQTLCAEREGLLLVDAAVALGAECGVGGSAEERREDWVTAVGLVLGLLSLVMLASLALIYAWEARKQGSLLPTFRRFAMRRTSSDLVGLIRDDGPLLDGDKDPPAPPLSTHHPTGTGKSVRFHET